MILSSSSFFFFNDTATTEIYTLSLHDALPISAHVPLLRRVAPCSAGRRHGVRAAAGVALRRRVRAVGDQAVRHRLHGVPGRCIRVVRLDGAAWAAPTIRIRRAGPRVRRARGAAPAQSRRLHRADESLPPAKPPPVRRRVRGLAQRRRRARPAGGVPAARRAREMLGRRAAPRTLDPGRRLADLEPVQGPGAAPRARAGSGSEGPALQEARLMISGWYFFLTT